MRLPKNGKIKSESKFKYLKPIQKVERCFTKDKSKSFTFCYIYFILLHSF